MSNNGWKESSRERQSNWGLELFPVALRQSRRPELCGERDDIVRHRVSLLDLRVDLLAGHRLEPEIHAVGLGQEFGILHGLIESRAQRLHQLVRNAGGEQFRPAGVLID